MTRQRRPARTAAASAGAGATGGTRVRRSGGRESGRQRQRHALHPRREGEAPGRAREDGHHATACSPRSRGRNVTEGMKVIDGIVSATQAPRRRRPQPDGWRLQQQGGRGRPAAGSEERDGHERGRHPDRQDHQDVRDGHERGARPAGGRPEGDARGARGHHGRVGLRQVDAHEHARVPRHADVGVVHARRRAGRRARQERARGDPQPEARLRLPGIQPAGADERRRERRAADALRPQRPEAGHPRPRRGGARARRARRPARAPAERAVGRAAAAGRHRPGPRDRAGARPGRRADRQPRLPDLRRGDGALPAAERAGEDDRRRHARARRRRLRHAHRPDAGRPDLQRRAGRGPARRGARPGGAGRGAA